ncbi:MAG: DUF86 domain-containing protein [Saprospiraceae bacterium]|nr:DUF86 domain-containing protein [Saprospiraceae bacterium]
MAKRQLNVYFGDIVESIEIIEGFVRGVSQVAFESNLEKQDAVIRRLAIIGEAIKHVPENIRTKYPEVPWRDAAGLRDVVVHEYFGVSLEVIWGVAIRELPILKQQIRRIQEELNL